MVFIVSGPAQQRIYHFDGAFIVSFGVNGPQMRVVYQRQF